MLTISAFIDLLKNLLRLIKLIKKVIYIPKCQVTKLQKELLIKIVLNIGQPTLFPRWLGLLRKPHINQNIIDSSRLMFLHNNSFRFDFEKFW